MASFQRTVSGATGRFPMNVPFHPKGGAWQIATRPVNTYPGERVPAAPERFAAAIRASFEARHRKELARPTGDGLCAGATPTARRVKPPIEVDFRGKRVKRLRADQITSKLHRHSKRCLSRTIGTNGLPRAGWWWCKVAGTYPGLPLHEHRTKRGRVFLIAHLNDQAYACPFDVDKAAPEQVAA